MITIENQVCQIAPAKILNDARSPYHQGASGINRQCEAISEFALIHAFSTGLNDDRRPQ